MVSTGAPSGRSPATPAGWSTPTRLVTLVPADGDRRGGVLLDGSARADSVLPTARRLAKAHDAELLIAHVAQRMKLTKVGPLTLRTSTQSDPWEAVVLAASVVAGNA